MVMFYGFCKNIRQDFRNVLERRISKSKENKKETKAKRIRNTNKQETNLNKLKQKKPNKQKNK